MMANRMSAVVVILAFTTILWSDKCYGQSRVPVYQNLTFAAIRLMSNLPTSINRGRVELQLINDVWGTICPVDWSPSVAASNVNATCSMLGFRNGGSQILNTFGDGNKNFLIENATCPMNATSWYQCIQYFAKHCGPQNEELAVECYPDPNGSNFIQLAPVSAIPGSGGLPEVAPLVNNVLLNGTNTSSCIVGSNVRLLGGDAINKTVGNGYVQVNVNGQWGYVCGDFWNQAAAKVVCRELCYDNSDGFQPLPGIIAKSVHEPINRTILLDSLNCQGNESSLFACPVVNSRAACRPESLLAGVQCRPDCCTDKPIIKPDVNCSSEILVVNFSKLPLITTSNIFMVKSVPRQCMNVTSGPGGVIATISTDSVCGADLQQNSTHLTYSVQIKVIWLSDARIINSYYNARYDLVCSVPKAYTVTNRMEPFTLSPNMTINEQYTYYLRMDLYTNCNFTQLSDPVGSVYFMEVGQWLDAAITVENYDIRTKLVITDCDAYPVMPYSAYTPLLKLIQDKCPVDSTLTMYSLDNRRQGFQVKAFMFAGYSMVYIRCSVNICLLNSTSSDCDRNCAKILSGRKKRSASLLGTSSVDTKSIFVFDSNDSGASKILQIIRQPQSQSNGANNMSVTETNAGSQSISNTDITAGLQTTYSKTQQTSQPVTNTPSPSSTTTILGQLFTGTSGPSQTTHLAGVTKTSTLLLSTATITTTTSINRRDKEEQQGTMKLTTGTPTSQTNQDSVDRGKSGNKEDRIGYETSTTRQLSDGPSRGNESFKTFRQTKITQSAQKTSTSKTTQSTRSPTIILPTAAPENGGLILNFNDVDSQDKITGTLSVRPYGVQYVKSTTHGLPIVTTESLNKETSRSSTTTKSHHPNEQAQLQQLVHQESSLGSEQQDQLQEQAGELHTSTQDRPTSETGHASKVGELKGYNPNIASIHQLSHLMAILVLFLTLTSKFL